MIEINLRENKFCRTYIGGSKKKELEIFMKVQGTKIDDCDWLEYRRLMETYMKDVLHVLNSWKTTFRNESYAMLFIASLYMKHPILFYGFITLGVFCQIAFFIFQQKEKRNFRAYDACQTIILHEIKKKTGFVLDKN
jgi:hypothetical protein